MQKKFNIKEYLDESRFEIDRLIEKYLPRRVTKEWVERVFKRKSLSLRAVQGAILDPIWNFLDRGGKRWRAALFLLLTEIFGEEREKMKEFALIPEVIHNGTLIIDDIEDKGELRRGKPCLHKIFGQDIAINVGNFMYYFPLLVFLKNKKRFKTKILIRAYQIYIQEMINLSLGQATDIFWHKGKEKEISEKEYFQMCAFKTGCLLRMAAKLAVVLSGKSEKLAEKIGRAIEKIGIAFQIQDDILDLTLKGREREKFGKAFGNDIQEGKRSLMVIYALKKAAKKDKKRLIEILNKHTDDIEEKKEAIEIIKKYGAIEYAQKRRQEIIKEGWREIDKILPERAGKEKLKNLINYLISRKV